MFLLAHQGAQRTATGDASAHEDNNFFVILAISLVALAALATVGFILSRTKK